MDIYENLEQLNVSEECFNDILSYIEEDLYDLVGRAEEKGRITPEKASNLKERALKIGAQERLNSQNRDSARLDKYQARELMTAKRDSNRNLAGEQKTDLRRIESHNKKGNFRAAERAEEVSSKHIDDSFRQKQTP